MPIVVNKNTTQKPMSQLGRTGAQSVKFIPAPRVYVKTADSMTAAPVQDYFTKSNGVTPTGWTDLGTVLGQLKVTYTQKVKEVTTGIDQVLRGAYVDSRTGTFEFSLQQLDDVTFEQISGITASVITAGSVVSYGLGSTDLNQLAMLLVCQNKFDGKEWQFYNPNAYTNFAYEEQGDAFALKVTGYLPFFTPQGTTVECILQSTVFA